MTAAGGGRRLFTLWGCREVWLSTWLSTGCQGAARRPSGADIVSKRWSRERDSNPRPALYESAGIRLVPCPDIASRLLTYLRTATDMRCRCLASPLLATRSSPNGRQLVRVAHLPSARVPRLLGPVEEGHHWHVPPHRAESPAGIPRRVSIQVQPPEDFRRRALL